MNEQSELLRRRVTLYRCYLREGVSSDQAKAYLDQIRQDEAALKALADESRQQHRPRFSAVARTPQPGTRG